MSRDYQQELIAELCTDYETHMGFFECSGSSAAKEKLNQLASRLRMHGIWVDPDDPENTAAGQWLNDHR